MLSTCSLLHSCLAFVCLFLCLPFVIGLHPRVRTPHVNGVARSMTGADEDQRKQREGGVKDQSVHRDFCSWLRCPNDLMDRS